MIPQIDPFLDSGSLGILFHNIRVFLIYIMPVALIALAIMMVGLLIYVISNAFRKGTGNDDYDDYDSSDEDY